MANDSTSLEASVKAMRQRFERGVSDAELFRALLATPTREKVIGRLLADPSGDLRAWGVQAVKRLVDHRAIDHGVAADLLENAALHDRDPDNRDDATRLFVELFPARIHELIPPLRRRLTSPDYRLPVAAMWLLFKLGDRAAIPLIEKYRNQFGGDVWQGKEAEIVLALFADRDDELAERIATHDHDMMHVLCRAARLRRREVYEAALQQCADGRLDPDCSRRCEESLADFRSHGSPPPQ